MLSLCCKRIRKYPQKLFEQLVFGEIIVISLEAYFEFLIGGYMNYLFSLDEQSGETVGIYSAYYSLGISVIILPAFMLYILV